MKLSSVWLLCLLPLVAACAGGGADSRVVPQSEIAPLGSQPAVGESDAKVASKATPVPVSTDLLYVANSGNSSITIYRHDASGNTAPIKVISGSKTGINLPGQLSEDATGNLYVVNNYADSYGTIPNILVFAHGANGNVEPIRNLLIPLNGVSEDDDIVVNGMTVDQVTGKIFVARQENGVGGYLTLLRFPPNATGHEAPYAISAIFAEETPEIANDSTGQRIIVPHNVSDDCYCSPSGIDMVAKQFPNGVNPYLYSFNFVCPEFPVGPQPCYGPDVVNGMADDPTTKTYVVSTRANYGTGGILRFSENVNSFAPISSITSVPMCVEQVALGYLRNIYVAVPAEPICGKLKDSVYVYEHDANGNVPPLRVLSGPKTLLNSPVGVYEGK